MNGIRIPLSFLHIGKSDRCHGQLIHARFPSENGHKHGAGHGRIGSKMCGRNSVHQSFLIGIPDSLEVFGLRRNIKKRFIPAIPFDKRRIHGRTSGKRILREKDRQFSARLRNTAQRRAVFKRIVHDRHHIFRKRHGLQISGSRKGTSADQSTILRNNVVCIRLGGRIAPQFSPASEQNAVPYLRPPRFLRKNDFFQCRTVRKHSVPHKRCGRIIQHHFSDLCTVFAPQKFGAVQFFRNGKRSVFIQCPTISRSDTIGCRRNGHGHNQTK